MPSHIYYRVGRYLDSLKPTGARSRPTRRICTGIGTAGIYPGAYYPHNIHFLMASAQMAGDAGGVRRRKGSGKVKDEVRPRSAGSSRSWPLPISPTRSSANRMPSWRCRRRRTNSRSSRPCGITPVAWLRPQPAMWRRRPGGRRHSALERTADFSGLNAGVPAPALLELSRHVVQARIAQAQGVADHASPNSRPRRSWKASFPTWSRPSGTIRFSNPLERHCSRPAASMKPSRLSPRA